ncbi:MAG: prolyl oligopeptidase family serine peptidase [Chitinophagaceae bacterium]|nr:prolyl oligopeptidase family serine peptidase [Chitinophagaceae bacterium]
MINRIISTLKAVWVLPAIICFPFFVKAQSSPKIKIACIGNSITAGWHMLQNPATDTYPAHLQHMLGDKYEVFNFGVSGATALRKGDNPYMKTAAFRKAMTSGSDIVLIKLGTNDSRAVNRFLIPEYLEQDYGALIDSFKTLRPAPRIILLLPVPSYLRDTIKHSDKVIIQQIIPVVQQLAYEKKCEVLDLHSWLTDQQNLFPDSLHPDVKGMRLIAERVYETIVQPGVSFDIFKNMKEAKQLSSFHGYECADFTFNGRACKIVKPKIVNPGKQWIWRARFWGHEPQTDIALLERGFHVAYCDVAELFGNTEAVAAWNSFYNYMHRLGLNKKMTLEGFSRGGVYVYNWALANKGRVNCIYADAPVLDLKSWPGGKGKGPGSASDWETFKKDYRLATDEEAMAFNGSPLDKAHEIAKLKIPLLHVVGDADEVVPLEENTAPFEQKTKAAGGNIMVIHKPGVKHHPHSLPNPGAIVDFVLKATYGK